MAKMRAVDAAVLVLEKEGVDCAFGVPGAAINPFYSALKARGTVRHILARHVEGASHMAEGYTRAKHGNIGVCIGTSGPAGTDMITGLYSAQADSIPILCITGQAPRARLDKEDFQAVDIARIAGPLTKWAVTVMEPALVPFVFQKAFHLMRSGRPGPVLIDLPVDVQLAEIEFDIDTYAPLEAYKPSATRAQAEKAIAMLNEAERPLIVAGGGIINADASDLLTEFAEITGIPVIPTLMGWGTIPDDHPLMAGMCGLQTSHRYGNANLLASDFVLGVGNRWANRHTGNVPTYTEGRTVRPCRYRADPDRPRLRAGFRHRLGCGCRAETVPRCRDRMEDGGQAEGLVGLGGGMPRAQADHAAQDAFRPDAAEAPACL
jgi:tartronate-semialdehyde synthase